MKNVSDEYEDNAAYYHEYEKQKEEKTEVSDVGQLWDKNNS